MSVKNNFIQLALEQAKLAFENDEVPVGAVIVKDGNVIAAAHNRNILDQDATAHAETLVIRQACKELGVSRLDDCDLYVTLEPCAMCAMAISLARIRRVYYAASDEKYGAVENGAKIYQSSSCHHIPEVYSGFSEKESRDLLQKFFRDKR